jgi:hypothetical protein
MKERWRRRRRYPTGAGIALPSEPMPVNRAALADRDSGSLIPEPTANPGGDRPGRGRRPAARACNFMAHLAPNSARWPSAVPRLTEPDPASTGALPQPPRANQPPRLTLTLAPATHRDGHPVGMTAGRPPARESGRLPPGGPNGKPPAPLDRSSNSNAWEPSSLHRPTRGSSPADPMTAPPPVRSSIHHRGSAAAGSAAASPPRG